MATTHRDFTLALGGGGAKGYAHLGVLQVLEDHGLRPAAIAGTSVGAIVGALLAAGYTARQAEHFIRSVPADEAFRRQNHSLPSFLGLAGIEAMLHTALGPERTFDQLDLPFGVTAVDLHTGRLVYLRRGPVVPAVLASAAVPGIFPPVPWGGRLLVDGDVVEKVPVTAARQLGPGPVVGVDVSNPVRLHKPHNSFEVMLMASEASIRRLKRLALERADYVLSLVPDHPVDTFDYSQANALYAFGYETTQAHLPELEALLAPKRRGLFAWLQREPQRRKG